VKKKVSRLEIYQLLIGTHLNYPGEQHYITKIAEILNVSKQCISKFVKEMENGGYIRCDTPNANQKFYSATTKIYDAEKPISLDGYELTDLGRRPGIIVQKARFKIRIEREYTDFFNLCNKNLKPWKWGNCNCIKYVSKVFDNFDTFEFRKTGKDKLIVIVPGLCFKKCELGIAHHTLFWITFEALKWFAKKAKIRFDWNTLHLCQKPHITRAAHAAWVKRIANNFSLSIDGKMLDSSGGKENWECLVFDEGLVDAVGALENWDNIAVMQGEIKRLHSRMDGFENVALPALQHSVDTILKETLKINNILKPKSTPDDLNNPCYG